VRAAWCGPVTTVGKAVRKKEIVFWVLAFMVLMDGWRFHIDRTPNGDYVLHIGWKPYR